MIRMIKHWYHFLLAVLAAYKYGFPGKKLTVIGVTGTDGKTTTTNLLYEILQEHLGKTSMISTVGAVIGGKVYDTGFHVTTPDAEHVQKYLREMVDHGDRYCVLEVTSHALDQYRVWGIPFRFAVLTNITHEHLDYHKTFGEYQKTKFSLLKQAPVAVVNLDDEGSRDFLLLRYRGKIRTYSKKQKADVTPAKYPIHSPLPGEYNLENSLAALCAATELGVSATQAISTLEHFSGVIGRMEVLSESPIRVIVDFAHTPNALVQVLSEVKKTTKKRLIHVFGSAGLRDASKRPFMGKASSKYSDLSILTEEDYRTEKLEDIMDAVQDGMDKDHAVIRIGDRREAIVHALRIARPGDTVIITGKGHEGSLCRGTVEYPWSDREETKKLLSRYVFRK